MADNRDYDLLYIIVKRSHQNIGHPEHSPNRVCASSLCTGLWAGNLHVEVVVTCKLQLPFS